MVVRVADSETVRRAQGGDRTAFAELVREYGPRALNLARRLVADRDSAGEVTQEALVKAWSHLPQLKEGAAFYPWLARIVVNQARNVFRSRARRPLVDVDIDADFTEGRAVGRPEAPGPLKNAQEQELRGALERAVAELPFNYRTALVMFTVDGMKHSDIAAALDIPEETVRWRVHQARKMLREKLKQYMD
jgi:RNA polymerase sigma-70 factor (ECF subfamily)